MKQQSSWPSTVEERVEVTEDTQIQTTAASQVETIKEKLHQI
jgi:hypothetical protein